MMDILGPLPIASPEQPRRLLLTNVERIRYSLDPQLPGRGYPYVKGV